MAKGLFKSNTPKQVSTSGMSAKDVLAQAAGKKSGEQLTEQDINRLVSSAGLSETSAKRVLRGAKQLLTSGYDYRLTDDGGFNVVAPGEQGLNKSSRKAGNVKGFNAGDIISLGRNVSTLMGLAQQYKREMEPRKEETTLPPTKGAADVQPAFTSEKGSAYFPSIGSSADVPSTKTATKTGNESTTTSTAKSTKATPASLVNNKTQAPQDVPSVDLPGIDEDLATKMQIALNERERKASEAQDAKYQRDYSNYLRNKYSNVYQYLTAGRAVTPSDVNQQFLRRDFEKISQTQPNLWQYLLKYHADQVYPYAPIKRDGGKLSTKSLMKGQDGIKMGRYDQPVSFSDDVMKNLMAQGQQSLAARTASAKSLSSAAGGYESITPDTNLFSEQTGLDKFQGIAKYALPFIGEALGRKQLKNIKPIEYRPVDLMTGTVSDLPKPNYKLRYREPVGNDVQSREGAQKFGDAVQREMETNYQIQNALNKQQQREQILQNTNQGRMFNASRQLQIDAMNANLKSGVAGARAASMVEPFVAAQQHLASDTASKAYLSSTKNSELAAEIIRHPERFGGVGSNQWNQAVKFLGNGNRGLKFKIS